MKLFVLVNAMLGPVFQGQEASHQVASFLLSGQKDPYTLRYITEWVADAERTLIVKKGGHHGDLAKIHAALISSEEIAGKSVETLKHSIHRDSRMNSCIMSVGILVPDDIYQITEDMRDGVTVMWDKLDNWTKVIMNTISSCPNAI